MIVSCFISTRRATLLLVIHFTVEYVLDFRLADEMDSPGRRGFQVIMVHMCVPSETNHFSRFHLRVLVISFRKIQIGETFAPDLHEIQVSV